jgi:hypothetical protein
MTDTIAVSVTLGDRKVTIEGPEAFVHAEVRRLTDMITGAQPPANMLGDADPHANRAATEREFVAEKRPKGHSEHIAVLALYLTRTGKAEFREDDVRRAYIRAGVKPPKAVAQAIRDAKDHYEYIEAGSERGSYKILHHGENFVSFDLPRKE